MEWDRQTRREWAIERSSAERIYWQHSRTRRAARNKGARWSAQGAR